MSNRWPPAARAAGSVRAGSARAITGDPESPVRTGDRADTGACRTRVIRLGFPASVSARARRQGRAERVEDPAQGHHDGDDSADREDAHGGSAGGPQDVADRHPPQAATREREPPREAGEPASRRRPGADPDRLDRRNTDPAPHRIERREEWDDQPQRGPAREDAGLERRAEERQGGELLDHRAQQPRDAEAGAHAECHAEQRHLDGEQERAQREGARWDSERHADADLPALRLHDPADQVERREGRSRQQQPGEDVDEPLVALGVGVREPVGLLLRSEGDGGADRPGARARERPRAVGRPPPHPPPGDSRTTSSLTLPAQAGEAPATLASGMKSTAKFASAPKPTPGGRDHEVLGLAALADVADGTPARNADRAPGGQPVVLAEVRLQDRDRAARVARREASPALDERGVDRRPRDRRPDQPPGHEHGRPAVRGVHLGRDHQALLRRGHVAGAGDRGDQPAQGIRRERCCPRSGPGAGRAAAGARSSRRPTSSRQVWTLPSPRPSRSRGRSPARGRRPASSARAGRGQTIAARGPARRTALTTAGRTIGARPPGGGPSLTTRPLESSITRSATREISRLCVTTSTAVPAVGLLVQQLEDLHAGAEVELAGRLVGQQDRVARWRGPARSPPAAARRRTARAGSGPRGRPARRARASARATCGVPARRPATSAPNCTFSSAVSAGNRLKVWKMKLTVAAPERGELRRATRG